MIGGASRIMYFETEGTSQASWYTPVIPIPKRLRQRILSSKTNWATCQDLILISKQQKEQRQTK